MKNNTEKKIQNNVGEGPKKEIESITNFKNIERKDDDKEIYIKKGKELENKLKEYNEKIFKNFEEYEEEDIRKIEKYINSSIELAIYIDKNYKAKKNFLERFKNAIGRD